MNIQLHKQILVTAYLYLTGLFIGLIGLFLFGYSLVMFFVELYHGWPIVDAYFSYYYSGIIALYVSYLFLAA